MDAGSSEEYLLKWRDYHSNFFRLADDLFANEQLTDVTLVCADQLFEAHQLVLSVCSPYFRAIFTRRQLMPHQHPVVFLKDIEPIELSRLLQYMYQGEVRLPHSEMDSFIAAANNLSIRGLCSLPKTPVQPPPSPPTPPPPPPPPVQSPPLPPTLPRKKQVLKRKYSEDRVLMARQQQSGSGKENHSKTRRDSAAVRVKLEETEDINSGGVSPPPLTEKITLIQDDPLALTVPKANLFPVPTTTGASSGAVGPPRILPPNEPRKSGTCYFCKKAFMKNKQLMNHICPKKPRLDGGSGSG